MDSIDNRSDGDTRKRRYVGRNSERATSSRPKPRYHECRVLRSDEAMMVATFKSSPRIRKPDLFLCPFCPRCGLPDVCAFRNHLKAKHAPVEIIAAVRPWRADSYVLRAMPKSDALLETAEEALIRIVNSDTHKEAVRIATEALCGKVDG